MAVSRRDFVKAAGATALASLGTASVAMASPVPVADIEWAYEADVVICGSGTAASAAAVSAADGGASVLVIEMRDWAGGQLRRCGGGIAAAETQVQKALGVEDNADDFADFWMATTDGLGEREIIDKLCHGSAGLIDWIIDDLGGQPVSEWQMAGENNGLEYDEGPGLNIGAPYQYEQFGFEPKQRCHWFTKYADDPVLEDPAKYFTYPTGGGTGLYKVFADAMEQRGVDVMLETALTKLVTLDATNEVIGIVAQQNGEDIYIKANKAVLIATGTFANNPEMFHNYIGEEYIAGAGGGIGLDLAEENDGSGIKAAMAVGADLFMPRSFGMNQDAPNGASFVFSGLKTNTDAQVIDVFGNPVPRLYAAGLAGGGAIVNNYPMCGASVARGLFYGKVAGEQMAALEPWA